MTAQTYQSDDGQLVQEPDQNVPDSDLLQPDLAPPVAETELVQPDADLATGMSMPDSAELGEPEADDAGDEDFAPVPADAGAPADSGPANSMDPDYPAFSAGGDDAEDTAVADSSAVVPEPVSPAFAAPESADLTGPPTASHLPVATTGTGEPWNEIQALFVDDPRASIERAAGLVDSRVEQFVQSVRDRQHSAQSAWQADGAGTEEMRVALQHYRAFWTSLEDFPAHD
jgi:hypothetical protein